MFKEKLLLPIFIVGVGRSGTTRLMAELGRDNRCMFDRTYAFESRALSYLAKFACQVSGMPLNVPSLNVNLFEWEAPDFDPLASPIERVQNLSLNENSLLKALWQAVSRDTLAKAPSAKYYAEKCDNWVPYFARLVVKSCTIVLVRDPRDIYISQIDFMKKVPYAVFGTPEESAAERSINLSRAIAGIFETQLFYSDRDDVFLLRYEDLILDSGKAMAPIAKQTGWRSTNSLPDSNYMQHKTSGSPIDSIGRWKSRQIPLEVDAYFNFLLKDMMLHCGYDLSPNSVGDEVDSVSGRAVVSSDSSCQQFRFLDAGRNGAELIFVRNDAEKAAYFPIRSLKRAAIQVWVCLIFGFDSEVSLWWRDAEEQFDERRKLSLKYRAGSHCQVLAFDVEEDENWTGKIVEMKISFVSATQTDRSFFLKWIKFVPAL